jgi:hypothetical protein
MPVRKMLVKMYDEDEDCYTITFEGCVTREKAVQFLDLAELLVALQGRRVEWPQQTSTLSKYDQIRLLIERNFPQDWFFSKRFKTLTKKYSKNQFSLARFQHTFLE